MVDQTKSDSLDTAASKPFKIPPLYWEIGKAAAMTLAQTYATVNPLVGLGVAAARSLLEAQETIAKLHDTLLQAQSEGWTEDDERWEAPLAEQQERWDTEVQRSKDLQDGGDGR